MADKKPKMTPEEKALEKERLDRIKKEEKELQKKAKEKKKRQLDRQKRIRKKERTEERRIKQKVNFPFKLLFNTSFFITMISFIFLYFGSEIDMQTTIYISGMIFTFLFFGIGLVMVMTYYVKSEEKLKEMESKRKKEEADEEERLRQEEEELERLLREEVDSRENEGNDYSQDEPSDPILLGENSSAQDIPGLGDLDNLTIDNEPENAAESIRSEEESSADIGLNPNSSQDANTEESSEVSEPDPFFSEDDFMNEVVFGSGDDDKG
jgi:cytochrome b subunit of formate dehydrogenase